MKRARLAPGFTFLELMVVVLVIGILAAAAIYSLNITRAMNRDAKRTSDVSVIRAALTQYWLQKASYPQSDPVNLGSSGTGADRLTGAGFAPSDNATPPIFLDHVPTAPKAGEYYRYHGSVRGYSLRFATERQTAYGPAGVWYAHAGGVDTEDSEK